jgi:hypothetical protein
MSFREASSSRLTAVVAGAAVLALVGVSASYAADRMGSSDIVNGSLRSVDIKNGTIKTKDLSDKTIAELKGAQGDPGTPGQAPAAADTGYQGANWSVVDRNTAKNGDSFLRPGPTFATAAGDVVEPPLGVGSLGIRTGDNLDKAAFGNQVDYAGDALSTITTVSYSIFTTGENNTDSTTNGPSVQFEIDPTGSTDPTGPNYSTLTYNPTALTAGPQAWTEQDATSAARWWLTGADGAGTGCTQASMCTLDEVKAELPNATLLTAQISKGKDYEYSGAVDALQISDQLFDFEPTGVFVSTVG